jgi:hypothetical protein
MAPSDEPKDLEWEATLAALVARAEAAEAAEREEAVKNPAVVVDRQKAERQAIVDAAARELIDAGVPDVTVEPLAAGRVLETSSLAKVRQWRRTRSWLLVLHGRPGIGKDGGFAWHLWQSALERAEARRGSLTKPPRYWLNAARIQRLGNYDGKAFDQLASLPDLVIADLGAEHHNGAWLSLLGDLLDERHGKRLRTMMSSNLSKEDLRAWVGDRIASRINAGGAVSGVDGPDLRKLGFDGAHGLPPAGVVETPRDRTEVEPIEGRRVVVQSASYRVRLRVLSPRARARRQQLALGFA